MPGSWDSVAGVDVAIPAGSIVTADIGNNSSRCNAFLKFTYVRQRLAALGAKIGRPKPPVFTFQGDGA